MNSSIRSEGARFLSVTVLLTWVLAGCSSFRGTSRLASEGGIDECTWVLSGAGTPDQIQTVVADLEARAKSLGRPMVENGTALILYRGKASRVALASDLNGWNPSSDTLRRAAGTDFFYLRVTSDPMARIEYKLVVDSLWILDPTNQLTSRTGFGLNSELRMQRYVPPQEVEPRSNIPHGTIDTIQFASTILGRTHPVIVYSPPGEKKSLPILLVTDGGEYLELARMATIIDNVIDEGRVRSTMAAFVDPRTDIHDSRSSQRMEEYTLNHRFLSFLTDELLPFLRHRYPISDRPEMTGIMGASLGGLFSTYAMVARPDVFGCSAAQSPSFWWKSDSIFALLPSGKLPGKFYIDTGTIRDAGDRPGKMAGILSGRGSSVKYIEVPESHNWGNWRARIPTILEYFWPVL
jgi:enterochelin esterase-like enzyme